MSIIVTIQIKFDFHYVEKVSIIDQWVHNRNSTNNSHYTSVNNIKGSLIKFAIQYNYDLVL